MSITASTLLIWNGGHSQKYLLELAHLNRACSSIQSSLGLNSNKNTFYREHILLSIESSLGLNSNKNTFYREHILLSIQRSLGLNSNN